MINSIRNHRCGEPRSNGAVRHIPDARVTQIIFAAVFEDVVVGVARVAHTSG